MTQNVVTVDERGRISLAKLGVKEGAYQATRNEDGTIELVPLVPAADVSAMERRYRDQRPDLFEPLDRSKLVVRKVGRSSGIAANR